MVELARSCRVMRKIPYRDKEIQPGDTVQGDDDLNAFIKEHVKSAYHPDCSYLTGTAKGPMAVVDPQCRVIGTVNRGSSGQLGLLAKASVALEVVAERGYFNSEEIVACERAGITLTLPKPPTSNATAQGRYGKRDFRYLAGADAYLCPAGERLTYRYTHEEKGLTLRRYWTNACQGCVVKDRCGQLDGKTATPDPGR